MAETALRKQLGEAILEDGLANSYFFNGRLLTAETLLVDQQANRAQHSQLGRALGDGVAYGLEVRLVSDGSDGRPPVVAVAAGLALNRRGEAIALPRNVEVALARAAEPAAQDGGLFAACVSNGSGNPLPGQGAYILAVRPASGFRDKAPRRGFGADARVAGCDRKNVVEGAQFRLEPLDLSLFTRLSQTTRDALAELITHTDDVSLARLRNWLAHLCLGTAERDELVRNLLSPQPPFGAYGAADALRGQGRLSDCDVPLALLFWPRSGVRFVDNWAERRRITSSDYAPWAGLIGDRLRAEGEAAFLQFQEQVAFLTRASVLRPQLLTIRARDYFRYLPAVGIIPFTTGLTDRGFDYLNFFTGMTVREPVFMEGRKVPSLIQRSFTYKPADTESGEMLWLYLVRENRQPLDGSPTPAPQPYLIFAHGHIPYQGEAAFDLSYWNFANYS